MPFIQPPVEPTPSGFNLQGKTCIVTGASAGIGLETCRQLLALNVTNLYMGVRNLPKGETVKNMLLQEKAVQIHNPKANIKLLKLDMDDYESIKDFCATVRADIPRVDILILNAGTGNVVYETSKTGHERTLQVNYLSNVLIVLGLLDHLSSSADKSGVVSRVTWVGSRMMYRTRFEKKPLPGSQSILSWMDDSKNYGMDQYSDSKFLAYLFMLDVAKRVPHDKVTFNILCPGMVYSDMANHLNWFVRTLTHLIWSIRARSTEIGAWIVVNAAVVAGPESNGKFLVDKEVQEYVCHISDIQQCVTDVYTVQWVCGEV